MSSEKIQIHLSSSSELGGFTQFNSALLGFGKAHDKVIGAAQRSVTALSAVFKNDLTASISSAVSLLDEVKKAGIWGVVSWGVSSAINLVVKKINEAAEAEAKVRKEFEDGWKKMGDGALSAASSIEKAFSRIDAAEKAAAEQMKSLREEFYAEQELAKQRDIASGGTGEGIDNAVRIQKRADAEEDADRRVLAAIDKLHEAERNERRVLRKTVNARTGARLGAGTGLEKAEEALEKAKAATEAARAELANAEAHARAVSAQNIADEYKAEREAAEKESKAAEERARNEERAAKEEEKAREDRINAETKAAEIQKRQHEQWLREREASFREQVDAAKKAATEWEKSAQALRGRTFNDIERARRDADRNGPSEFDRRNAANERKAERLATDMRRGLHLSDRERDWLRRFKEWKDAQDPKNNKAAQEAARLEKSRQEVKRLLEQIHGDLAKSLIVN